eukprot:6216415-Prymnesium_polylepis.1
MCIRDSPWASAGATQKSPHQPRPTDASKRQPCRAGGVTTGSASSQWLMRLILGRCCAMSTLSSWPSDVSICASAAAR